jgi:hypothetical protein
LFLPFPDDIHDSLMPEGAKVLNGGGCTPQPFVDLSKAYQE